MKLELKHNDLLKQQADAIINTVNCVGIMGKGIALQFKKAFPENYKAYAKLKLEKCLFIKRDF